MSDFQSAFVQEIEQAQQRSPSFHPDDWIVTGRPTREWPGKNDRAWWEHHGPLLVQAYVDWRGNHPWPLWTIGNQPAVELECNFTLPDGPAVKAFIDRVFVLPNGDLCVCDIKGLATDTPIATPSGWSTMGELAVGDEVFGPGGKPTTVTAKSQEKMIPCYRVHFDDGSSLICDEEHVWETHAGRGGSDVAVRSVREIAATLKYAGAKPQRQHRIPNPGPLTLPEADLPIHPYVLGIWLGDGKARAADYTKPDAEIADHIRTAGYEVRKWNTGERCPAWNIINLIPTLRENNLLNNKHVPAAYLRASVDQRLALLRGLMDSDGTWNTARDRASFTSTDKGLALAARELVTSLGERAHLAEVQRTGFGLTVTAYDVEWAPSRFNPFLLGRKAERVVMRSKGKSVRRLITEAEPWITVPTVCIQVDNASSMYLAGENMIPTHNSGSKVPDSAGQLGLYACAVEILHGIRPKWGTYWMARTGKHTEMASLDVWTPKVMASMFNGFIRAVNAGHFAPKPSGFCKTCTCAHACHIVGGPMAETYDPLAAVDAAAEEA